MVHEVCGRGAMGHGSIFILWIENVVKSFGFQKKFFGEKKNIGHGA